MGGGSNKKTVRIILCNGLPRFIQSLSIHCRDCKETTMAYEHKYVATLDQGEKSKLDAIIVGNSHGIDMSLIRAIRNGSSADEVENTARANLYTLWSTSKKAYEKKCRALHIVAKEFPDFPEEYVPKAAQLNKAFLSDFAIEKEWLKRELAALQTTTSLAIDHQVKLAKSVKAGDDKSPCQTLSVVGDCGIVLAHVVVGSDSKQWSDPCIREVVARHGNAPPKVLFVDKNCCNGKLGGRTDDTKMYCGMEKKLDTFHVMKRIGQAINSEHKQAATFLQDLSTCIFTCDPDDLATMESTRAKHPSICGNLSQKQSSCDRTKHVRRTIESGEKVCARIITLVVNQARNDKYAKEEYEQSPRYQPTTPITPSHVAYPLITKEVWKVIRQQLIHILNGCLSDDDYNMYVTHREMNYRSTGDMLPLYTCLRGTNKVEAVNSLLALKSGDWRQIGRPLFDARTFWTITNYNRGQFRKVGRQSLPNGVSPSEAPQNDVILAAIEDGKKVKFGFEYYNWLKEMTKNGVNDSLNQVQISEVTTFEYNNDEELGEVLLDSIIVPGEVGFEELGHLSNILERELPSVDSSSTSETSAATSPLNIEEECSKLMTAYNSSEPTVRRPSHRNCGAVDISAPTFLNSTEPIISNKKRKRKRREPTSADIELQNRQQIARNTMISNGISTDKDVNTPGKRKLCTICFKNKDTFMFQSRKHIQINSKEKGAKIEWYCPLVDSAELYHTLQVQRKERREDAKRIANKKNYEKKQRRN